MSGSNARAFGQSFHAALRCAGVARPVADRVMGPYAKRELLRLCARIGYTPH